MIKDPVLRRRVLERIDKGLLEVAESLQSVANARKMHATDQYVQLELDRTQREFEESRKKFRTLKEELLKDEL